MKNRCIMIVLLAGLAPMLFAETNALVEVKLFKTWVIESEWGYGNLTLENTGTEPLLLAKTAEDFNIGQLSTRSLDNKVCGPAGGGSYDGAYKEIELSGDGFERLPVGETKVYEGRKFLLPVRAPFSEVMRYKVSVYFGNGVFVDSAPLTVNGVVPDSEEFVATIGHNKFIREGKRKGFGWKILAISYRNEKWLYKTSVAGGGYYPICPVSLKNKVRVEPYDDALLFKIWDGDKSMLFHMDKGMIVEGPEENDVLGKWTREKKKEVKSRNAEVRRKNAMKAK